MKFVRRLPPLEAALVVVAVVVFCVLAIARRDADRGPLVDSYSTFDAASGGYRAWYEVLQREGVRVERFERQLTFLNADADTLVWAEPLPYAENAGSAAPAEVGAVEAWVRAGGHLLYLGFDDKAAAAGILKLPKTTGKTYDVGTYALSADLRAAGVRRIAWSSDLRRYARKRGAEVLAGDRHGALAVAYPFGRGRVLAVIDEALFRNRSLTARDNARFAFFLTQPKRAGGLVYFDEAPHGYLVAEHWWEIVPRPFLAGVIFAALALLLAFAGASVRLGPPLAAPRLRDPTSVEFVDSVAGLLERGGGARQAVADAVRSTKRALAHALGVSEDASNEALAARIETPALRSAFTALVAFERPNAPDDAALLRAVSLAQYLRKEFTTHAGSRR